MNNNYTNALNNWDKWDAVISATPEQSKDIEDRFGKSIPAFIIPVGYVTDAEIAAKHQDFGDDKKG
ncbi:hypothetical protein L3X07_13075 [Levilactobacillus brevis]|nr:hypothetical protein [Levilactobacillus brevis]